MTIAAGFWHRDGVLLCSDAQQEGGATKLYGPKIGFLECPGGKLGIALCGNVRFALSAIQKCAQELRSVPPDETLARLEQVLEQEYRRVVFSHPSYGKDDAIGYSLLISFWSSVRRDTSMFVTTEHTMSSCFDRFQAIGIGFELANVLARPFAFDDMSEEGTIALAAYILSQVKDNVPGCGGISQFVSMRNDGTVSPEWSLVTDQIQEVACKYDKACHELLFSMVGEDDVEFEKALLALTSTARQLKDRWRGSRNSNPAIAQYLLMTRGGWTPPQPSPESPEGSDEF